MQQQAINTFSEGLNYDVTPLSTPNNVLTDCVNGTFVTFNGDELAMQNDAGNTKIFVNQEATPYGQLYNWFAVNNANFAPEGWHVPTNIEFITLLDLIYIYDEDTLGYPIAGGLLKEEGYDHWLFPNSGATDTYGLSFYGAGGRDQNEPFENRWKPWEIGAYWCSNDYESPNAYTFFLAYDSTFAGMSGQNKTCGLAVKLIKDTSDWEEGETLTDYDGNVYNTVKVGDQVWITSNFRSLHYNNGNSIAGPTFTDEEWGSLDSGAYCYFNDIALNSRYITLSDGFYPLGIKEYGGVLYIVSGKLPVDPKTNIDITLWVQGNTYLQNKVVYTENTIERTYYKAKKNTSVDLPITSSQDWEVIGNEKDYNNMFGEVEFGSYPSPSASGSIFYEGNSVNFTNIIPTTVYRWIATGENSYCLVDVNGKNTGYRMTEEKYQSSTDGGNTWIDVIDTPVRNVSVINTTSCPLPIAFAGMVLDPTFYNTDNEYTVAFAQGQGTGIDTPIKAGYNYLFFSIPSTLTITVYNSLGIDITSSFSVFGVDDRPQYQTNTIYRKNDMFGTDQSTRFNLILT